ncbi:hypothetical protein [Pseudarthrobacter oxydans]|uniref:hypothetical protein n=1 Tax=Pseudarthrobacter oxydans TaxID=1671 RepID=UPI00344A7714
MTGPATENQVRAALDKAWDEMIFIGPDHPYYSLLAELVSAVGKSWQQGYDHGRRGGPHQPLLMGRPGRLAACARSAGAQRRHNTKAA